MHSLDTARQKIWDRVFPSFTVKGRRIYECVLCTLADQAIGNLNHLLSCQSSIEIDLIQNLIAGIDAKGRDRNLHLMPKP